MTAVLILVSIFAFVALFMMCLWAGIEGRLPFMGRWHRWRVVVEKRDATGYVDWDSGKHDHRTIGVYVRRAGSGKKVLYKALDPHDDEFDSSIAEAVAEARQRAMSLNGAQEHGRRSLPR